MVLRGSGACSAAAAVIAVIARAPRAAAAVAAADAGGDGWDSFSSLALYGCCVAAVVATLLACSCGEVEPSVEADEKRPIPFSPSKKLYGAAGDAGRETAPRQAAVLPASPAGGREYSLKHPQVRELSERARLSPEASAAILCQAGGDLWQAIELLYQEPGIRQKAEDPSSDLRQRKAGQVQDPRVRELSDRARLTTDASRALLRKMEGDVEKAIDALYHDTTLRAKLEDPKSQIRQGADEGGNAGNNPRVRELMERTRLSQAAAVALLVHSGGDVGAVIDELYHQPGLRHEAEDEEGRKRLSAGLSR